MARIANLSVEIHRLILNEVISRSTWRDYYVFIDEVDSLIEERRRLTSPGPVLSPPNKYLWSIFPFNAALTCRLWRDILAGMPNLWKRIRFDTTLDPSPLLDVFTWTDTNTEAVEDGDQEQYDVVIFTSATYPTEVCKSQERRRVVAITQALQPHIHRCTCITYNVMFASSLPPPTLFFSRDAPYLEGLQLECLVDDSEIEIHERQSTSVHAPDPCSEVEIRSTVYSSFQYLTTLVLAGISFMELCMFKDRGLLFDKLRTEGEFTLHISRFCFQQDLQDDAPYNMDIFTSGLSRLYYSTLHLSHLSLSYKWADQFPTVPFSLRFLKASFVMDINFDAVSKDFLSAFFSYVSCEAIDYVSYSRCAIPALLQISLATELTLDSIIDDPQENEYGVIENSIHRVLSVWEGTKLIVRSCPSFNDRLLDWLASKVEYTEYSQRNIALMDRSKLNQDSIMYLKSVPTITYPSERVSDLRLEDCVDYSVSQLRRLVEIRKVAERWTIPLQFIAFVGKVPPLEIVDVTWINEKTLNKGLKFGGAAVPLSYWDIKLH